MRDFLFCGHSVTIHQLSGLYVVPHLAALTDLRYSVWRDNLDDPSSLDDGHDPHALHWLAFHDARLIAAARMCYHERLSSVPDSHLYQHLAAEHLPATIGCMNRLVVDKTMRRLGLSRLLDRLRCEEAVRQGCRSMVVAWNPASGAGRRQAIQAQGFESLSNNEPVLDGKYGVSFPYGRRMVKSIEYSKP
jgi:GNAT superfamily N-acetyltransferase